VHLYLCMLINDLTGRYGPVIRQGRVTGVLDAAFDVIVVRRTFGPLIRAEVFSLSSE